MFCLIFSSIDNFYLRGNCFKDSFKDFTLHTGRSFSFIVTIKFSSYVWIGIHFKCTLNGYLNFSSLLLFFQEHPHTIRKTLQNNINSGGEILKKKNEIGVNRFWDWFITVKK